MTDKEIIKALECWIKNFEGKAIDYITLCNALDLINRQQAEIERLKELIDVRHKVFETKCEELETAKSEATKEFWEKLWELDPEIISKVVSFDLDELNNLKKEMVGEDK